MKVIGIVLYILALLLTFHQATYWGYGAATCPLPYNYEREKWIMAVYAVIFLQLLALPIIYFIVWGMRKMWNYTEATGSPRSRNEGARDRRRDE